MKRIATTVVPKIILTLWVLFFILNPFAIFRNGIPQPSDWILASIFAYFFLTGIAPVGNLKISLLSKLQYFVIYATSVNTLWFPFIDQTNERFPTLVHSLFYIFNYFALRSVFVLVNAFKSKFLLYTAYGIGVSMILQVALSFIVGSTSSRNALFFNNPNQLGYYALLSGSLLVYLVRAVKLPMLFQLTSYFSFFYLTLLSSSKAALAGSLILIVLAVLNQGIINIKQLFVLLVAIGIGSYFVFNNELGSKLFKYSLARFETIGESKDDSYEGRGYDRILNNPGYMVTGAGEGGYYRFDTAVKEGEIHSSFGSLLFCYGVVGFFLFMRFLLSIFKGSSASELLYFLPIAAYSITHQGLRDSLFWVFLGVIFILNEDKIVKRLAQIKQRLGRKNRKPSLVTPPADIQNQQ